MCNSNSDSQERYISHECLENQYQISASADGVLAPGSAHARPSARPLINTSRNFSAHISAE